MPVETPEENIVAEQRKDKKGGGNIEDITQSQDTTKPPSVSASSVNIPILEVDLSHDDTEADRTISDAGNMSSTSSIRSSVYECVEEHGRTYHSYKEGKYILPNDSDEQERLDLQHHLLLVLLDGKLHLAPIGQNPRSVLDVGTGTGIWPIEFALRYPSANVLGSDLSPIQPSFIPPNCRFEIDDAEDEWTYSTKFDFIHMRGMMTCFSDPRSIIAKAYDALAPGGYLEMQDGVFPMRCHDDTLLNTPLDIWGKACVEGAAKLGRPWTNTPNYKTWMEELGFGDVKEKIFQVPTSAWPKGRKAKELGFWFGEDLVGAVGATKAIFTRALGWNPEKVEDLFTEAKNCIKNKGVHAWMPIHVVYGKKTKL